MILLILSKNYKLYISDKIDHSLFSAYMTKYIGAFESSQTIVDFIVLSKRLNYTCSMVTNFSILEIFNLNIFYLNKSYNIFSHEFKIWMCNLSI